MGQTKEIEAEDGMLHVTRFASVPDDSGNRFRLQVDVTSTGANKGYVKLTWKQAAELHDTLREFLNLDVEVTELPASFDASPGADSHEAREEAEARTRNVVTRMEGFALPISERDRILTTSILREVQFMIEGKL